MYQSVIIGHLGADAEKGVTNGKSWVRFRVATTQKTRQGEETTWHSCILSGDGGALFDYLRRGQLVCVIGDTSVKVVSSPKLRRMVASSDISVQSVELLGGNNRSSVPRRIASPDGVLCDVSTAYFIDPRLAAEYCKKVGGNCLFYDERGGSYVVQPQGWVTPASPATDANPVDASTADDVSVAAVGESPVVASGDSADSAND